VRGAGFEQLGRTQQTAYLFGAKPICHVVRFTLVEC
jgi:hypothetical protein